MADSDDAVLLQRRARRRLIGAIALVVFVVIVLPIVFDKEPRPITHDLVIQIPSQDSQFKPRLPPEAAPKPAPAARDEEKKNERPEPERKDPVETPAPAPSPAAEGQKRPEPVPEQTAEASPETFMVPLGAYSNAANAKQVQSRVAAAGYKAYSESMKGPKGPQVRVRAGPFSTREAAERAREKLKSLGLNPVGAVTAREQP